MPPFFGFCENERELLALQVLITNLILDCLPMFCKRLDHLAPFHAVSTFVGQDSCSENFFRWPNIVTNWHYIFVDAFSLQTWFLPKQSEISGSFALEQEP